MLFFAMLCCFLRCYAIFRDAMLFIYDALLFIYDAMLFIRDAILFICDAMLFICDAMPYTALHFTPIILMLCLVFIEKRGASILRDRIRSLSRREVMCTRSSAWQLSQAPLHAAFYFSYLASLAASICSLKNQSLC